MIKAELQKLLGSESDTVEVKEEPSNITRAGLLKLLGGDTAKSMVEERPPAMTRTKLRELLGNEPEEQPSSWMPSDRFLATGAESIPIVDPFGKGLEKPSLMEYIAQQPAGRDSRVESSTVAAPSPLQLMPPLPAKTKGMSEFGFSKWKEKQLPTTLWKDRSEGERQMASGAVESNLLEDPVFNAMFGAGLGGKMAARTASRLAPIAKAAAREGASWVMWGADDIAKIANKGISETLYRVGRSQIAKKEGVAAKFLDPSSASVIDDVFINALNVVKKNSPKAVDGFLKKEEAVRKEIAKQLSKTAKTLEKQAAGTSYPISKRSGVAEKMGTSIKSMSDHIKSQIDDGVYTAVEFFSDPIVYFDKQIMGKHYNNPLMRKRVINKVDEAVYGGKAVDDAEKALDDYWASDLQHTGKRRLLPVKKGAIEEVPSVSNIVDYIRESFDIPIRTGGYKGKALGIYKPHGKEIRTRITHALDTILHETGHHIHQLLGLNTRNYVKELKPIATKGTIGKEGTAEFVKLYLMDELKAKKKAPGFYEHFAERLKTQPELEKILKEVQDRIGLRIHGSSEARFNAQINRGRVRRKIDIPTSARETYTSTLDKYHPIKKIGEILGDETEAYRSARLFEGWRGIPDTFLEKETFKFDNKDVITGRSLKDILMPVKKEKKNFGNYIMARRAEELHGRGIETGFYPVDAAFMKNKYQSSTFDDAFEEIKEYQDNVLQYLRDSGVVGPDQYLEIKNLNKDYVPFNTVLELLSKKGAGKSFGDLSKGIKGIKSTHLERVDPLEQIVANTYSLINLAERNRVGRLIGDWSKLKDSGQFVSKVTPKTRGTTLKIEEAIKGINPEVKKVLKEAGISDEVVTIFRPDAFTPQKNVIRVWEQGKPALYELHPELYKSVKGMSPREVSLGLKLLRIPASTLKAGAVVFSPEFAVRNPIRDQISAWLFSRSGYKPGLDMARGFMSALKKDKYYWEFKKQGGEHAALVSLDRHTLQKKLKDVAGGPSLRKLNKVVNPFEALRILNEVLEQGTRRGEFKRAVKKGQSLAESAFGAREVTLDFKRQGGDRLVQIMNQITPFFNPQLQGTDKLMRALGNKSTRKQTLIRLTFGITLPSVALYEYNKDFEWYQNLAQWERDLFWPLPIGGDWGENPSFVLKVGKPFDSGLLWGSVFERMLEYYHTNDPYSLKQTFETLYSGIMPPLFPQAAKTPYELGTGDLGYSRFYGRPVAPRGTEKLVAGYRTGQHEPEIIKKLGAATSSIEGLSGGISPSKISYGIKGWTGGAGGHVVNALDYLAKKTGVVDSAPGPETTWKEWPFIKGLIAQSPSRSGAPLQKLYDNIKDIGFKYNTGINNYKVAAQKNDPDKIKEADAYWDENINRINAHDQAWNIPESTNVPAQALTLEGTRQLLSKLSGMADLVYQHRDISPKEQKRQRDEIFLEMLNIAKMVNNQIRSFGK